MDSNERVAEMLRKLTIVQLGLADVPQGQIRKIVGGSMNEINSIVKLVRSGKKERKGNGSGR